MVEKPKYLFNGCSCNQAPNRGRLNDYPIRHKSATGVRLNARAGEIPLIGKGLPLTRNGEGEEIVYSHAKA
jgi:hypothetical protein